MLIKLAPDLLTLIYHLRHPSFARALISFDRHPLNPRFSNFNTFRADFLLVSCLVTLYHIYVSIYCARFPHRQLFSLDITSALKCEKSQAIFLKALI